MRSISQGTPLQNIHHNAKHEDEDDAEDKRDHISNPSPKLSDIHSNTTVPKSTHTYLHSSLPLALHPQKSKMAHLIAKYHAPAVMGTLPLASCAFIQAFENLSYLLSAL